MVDGLERRWDDEIEAAWGKLRGRVADRLAALEEDESFLLEVPDDEELTGATPYCQVLAGAGVLRVEAVSNTYLDDSLQLDDAQEAGLEEIGFEAPSQMESENFWADLEQREADRAAWMMVGALRRVYGVLHPAFLSGEAEDARSPADAERAPDERPTTYFPQDAEDVRICISAALNDLLGHDPEWDEDGDLPLHTERGVLYVTPARRSPRVMLHAVLVVDLEDDELALVEANILNRREFGLTFLVEEGRLSLRRELSVSRFVPQEFAAEVERISDDLDRWIVDLLDRLGGRGVLDEKVSRRRREREPRDARVTQAVRVLQELEREARGSVDTATLVRVFQGDRDRLLEGIDWAQSRASQWAARRRRADSEGKVTWAKACRGQQTYYLEMRRRLGAALRSMIQPDAGPERDQQLSLFAEDEASA